MSETDKITLPILELDLQKTTTYVARPFRLTQGDKGYWQAFHLSVGFQPYTITADKLCFAGTKPDGQLIDITNEPSRFELRDGVWYFKLPDELAQAVGTFTGYFYVVQGGTTVASTTKFAYEILAKFGEDEVSNSYVSIFNDLRDKFSQIVESSRMELNNWTSLNNKARADLDQLLKDLKTQTDNWLKAKTSEIEALIAKYNSKYNELVSQWNNQITTQQSRWQSQLNQQQSDFNSQKARIDSEYRQQLENLKSQLNSEWQQQKQAQQASFDSFKADLTNRISQAKSDIDSIQTKTTELQAKLDEINNKVRDVDFNSFIKVVNGNANDDLARFRNMCQLRIYDGNGQNVKSVPFQNNWFSVLVNMHSNWGTLTYLGQDRSIWQSSCNGDQWTSWTKLASTDYIDNKVQNARDITNANTWQDIFGDSVTSKDRLFPFRVATSSYIPNVLGDYASGIAFGKADVKGTIAVSNHEKKVVISGGSAASASPRWSGELSFKDDFANYYNKPEIDNKFKNIVLNIVDFGAKAEDSNFDNAPAFNRAIQSLPSTGGIIYIPNGNFFLKSTVTIDRSYVHIMGLNHGLRSGIDPSDGTTQTGGGGAKVTVQNSISAFKIQNTHNDKRLSGITFSGFDLKGDTNGGVGIDGASNTDRVVIDNMTINNIGTGVKLNGADAPRITNSWIAETKSSIQLTGASQQAEIKNNSLGAQPQGITVLLENADRYNISGNNIYPDGSSAIRLLNPVHGAIVGNTISAYYTGIIEMLPNDNTYGNSNVISGNVIAIESWKNNPIGRDSKWGIIHIEGYDNLISGNNILANGSPQDTTGILIMKGDRNKIATNVITIPNTSSKVVCNGSANNNTVVYSTDSSSFQNGLNSSNQNIDFDEVNALKKNYAILETQLNVLQGQMADLLGAISISGDTLQINGKLAVRGNVTTYWDGADQFIVYSGHNFKRGYFGMYDNGQFKVNG